HPLPHRVPEDVGQGRGRDLRRLHGSRLPHAPARRFPLGSVPRHAACDPHRRGDDGGRPVLPHGACPAGARRGRAARAPPRAALGLLYIGLILMILGNGFFKPNNTTIVGKLYAKGDVRREGGFTIFYMGINVGALSPFLVSYLAEKVSWHYGFMACGVGMTLG